MLPEENTTDGPFMMKQNVFLTVLSGGEYKAGRDSSGESLRALSYVGSKC